MHKDSALDSIAHKCCFYSFYDSCALIVQQVGAEAELGIRGEWEPTLTHFRVITGRPNGILLALQKDGLFLGDALDGAPGLGGWSNRLLNPVCKLLCFLRSSLNRRLGLLQAFLQR